MNEDPISFPKLTEFYHRYLREHDTARFVLDTSRCYTLNTLCHLARSASVESRRGATFALGFLGDDVHGDTVAERLADSDRAVRMIAINAIQDIWLRSGNTNQRGRLLRIRRMIGGGQFEQAYDAAGLLCADAPRYAEAWSDFSAISFYRGEFEQACAQCRMVITLNRNHFPAMLGLGHCWNSLQHPVRAIDWFRRALSIHPGLDQARQEIKRLERILRKR